MWSSFRGLGHNEIPLRVDFEYVIALHTFTSA